MNHHPVDQMKQAYVLVPRLLPGNGGGGTLSRSQIRTFDRVAGPYAAILKARGSTADIEQLAVRLGAALGDVCWLQDGRVGGGGAPT